MSFIIGPHESKEQFEKRIASCQNETPIEVFGLCPNWIPVIYSNKSLALWEGGCAWIQDQSVTLQLRKSLQTKESYLGLVSKKELLQHEAVHALRLNFDEPRFEEILAYQTSASRWRRYWGPLFRSSKESLLIFLLPLVWFFPFLGVLFGYAFLRLFVAQRTFARAKKKLGQMTSNPLGLMLHLTDQEIALFAKKTNDQIKQFIQNQDGFRWTQIRDFVRL